MAYRIKNWKKFQHFKDRRPPWIKLYRDLLDDVEWFNLDPSAAKFLVMLWLMASENPDTGQLPPLKNMAFRLRTDERKLSVALSRLSHWLEHDDIDTISGRYQDATPEQETERETERETETNRAQARVQYSFSKSFEILWSRYPRRDGKKEAYRHFKATVQAEADYLDIQKALANYQKYLKENRTEPQFIKMGSTWFNNWRDWIDWQGGQNGNNNRPRTGWDRIMGRENGDVRKEPQMGGLPTL